MKKVIFDTAITGHHSEYIGHLLDYLYKHDDIKTKYYFVVHPCFATSFPSIYEKVPKIKNVEWCPIRNDELQRIQRKNGVISSLMAMKIMDRYAKKISADHVIALDFHPLKYGSTFYTPPYTMSSILFLLFHRLDKNQKLEYYKRYFLIKWSTSNKQLRKVFILNDLDAVAFMNEKFKTNCFDMLPDPIPDLKPLENFDVFNHYKIQKDRKIFLHIGALGERKGTREVIEAATHLDATIQQKTAILIAGKASKPSDAILYSELIEEVRNKTKVHIIWDNQFVPNQMMKSLFNQCDTVLLPYKNAEFSSGILGHAAAAHKKVIATNAGLIKELVTTYKLGVLLDDPTAAQLAKKITEMMKSDFEISGHRFVDEHDPTVFAKMLLHS